MCSQSYLVFVGDKNGQVILIDFKTLVHIPLPLKLTDFNSQFCRLLWKIKNISSAFTLCAVFHFKYDAMSSLLLSLQVFLLCMVLGQDWVLEYCTAVVHIKIQAVYANTTDLFSFPLEFPSGKTEIVILQTGPFFLECYSHNSSSSFQLPSILASPLLHIF